MRNVETQVQAVLRRLGIERPGDYPAAWQEQLPRMARVELLHQVHTLRSKQPIEDAAKALALDFRRIAADFASALF